MEFAIVLYLNRCNKESKEKETNTKENDFKLETFVAKENSVVDILGKKERSFDVRRIDKAALYSNIIVLIIFNLIYWLKFRFLVL